jgi:hypothetical protein
LQPQPPPPQQPPPFDGADEEERAADFPFDGEANTESWIVCFALEHFGQVIDCDRLSTMRS